MTKLYPNSSLFFICDYVNIYLLTNAGENDMCERYKEVGYFSHRVVECWNALDQHTVDAPSIGAFERRLDKDKLGWAFMD